MSAFLDVIKKQMDHAIAESRRSLNWYIYTVETVAQRTRLPIDGDWHTRRWWFVLREVPCTRSHDNHLGAVDA